MFPHKEIYTSIDYSTSSSLSIETHSTFNSSQVIPNNMISNFTITDEKIHKQVIPNNNISNSNITDKRIRKVVLKNLNSIPLKKLNKLDQDHRLKHLAKHLVGKYFKKRDLSPKEQKSLRNRIQEFIKTSQEIDQKTLDCLFLTRNWIDQIEELSPHNEPGYVSYVASLCETEVEAC